jgi:excisionase family DNA binding protein
MNPQQPERLAVSQSEAARLFGVTPQTIRRWELRGLITGTRPGGRLRFYPFEQLRRLVEQGPPNTTPRHREG